MLAPFVPRRLILKLLEDAKNLEVDSAHSSGSGSDNEWKQLSYTEQRPSGGRQSLNSHNSSQSTNIDHGPFLLHSETERNVTFLFVDMSGFTSSMEKFSAYGYAGIESFWRIVNSFFGTLLHEVCNRGGDVQCFAGDAMLIVFPSSTIVANSICQAIRAAAIEKTYGCDVGEDCDKAILPDLMCADWAAKLTSLLAIDAAAGILRHSPFECSDVKIGKHKFPLSIHLTLHGGIGTGTCMFNNFSFIRDSLMETKGWCFPFGLAIVDMTNADSVSSSGEVILSSKVAEQIFFPESGNSDDSCGGYWIEAGWVERRENGTFLLYSDGCTSTIPPPLLGGLLSVDCPLDCNDWPKYSPMDDVFSYLDSISSQNIDEPENVLNARLARIVTRLAKTLELYVPSQLTEQVKMDSNHVPLDEDEYEQTTSSDKKTGFKKKGSFSSEDDRRSITSSTHSMAYNYDQGCTPAKSSPRLSPRVSSLMSMVGELREATVGFVKFDTSALMELNVRNSTLKEKRGGYLSMAWVPSTRVVRTPRDEMSELQNIISECVDAADAVLSHGGLVNKFLMDDKGLSMLYAFGTPGCSYEGNSFRALWVALDIRMRIGELHKHGFGIGIASGRTCVSILGLGSLRCEYAIAGSTVNMASRLADHSLKLGKGAVLTDARTIGLKEAALADDSLEGITLQPGIMAYSLGDVELKGRSDSMRIYTAKREHLKVNVDWKAQDIWMGRTCSSHGPVGRKTEFKAIRDCLPFINNRQHKGDALSCFLLVEGGAGMGKSLLLKHILSLCGGVNPDIVRIALQKPGAKPIFLMHGQELLDTVHQRRASLPSTFEIETVGSPESLASTDNGSHDFSRIRCSINSTSGSLSPVYSTGSLNDSSRNEPITECISEPEKTFQGTTSAFSILQTSCSSHSMTSEPCYDDQPVPPSCREAIRGKAETETETLHSQNDDETESMSLPTAASMSDTTKLTNVQIPPETASDSVSSVTNTPVGISETAVAFHCCSDAEQLQPLWPVVNLVSQLLAMCIIPYKDGSFNRNDVHALLSRQHVDEYSRKRTVLNVGSLLDSLQFCGLTLVGDDEVQHRHIRKSLPNKCKMYPSWSERDHRRSRTQLPRRMTITDSINRNSGCEGSHRRRPRKRSSGSMNSDFCAVMQGTQSILDTMSNVIMAVIDQHGSVVILIDDVHMMDSSVMKVMMSLVRCHQNAVFVFASRGTSSTSPATAHYYTKLRSSADKCIILNPLEPEQSRELACHFLEVQGIDNVLFQLVKDNCNGNIVFIKELCENLVAQGSVLFRLVSSFEEANLISSHLSSVMPGGSIRMHSSSSKRLSDVELPSDKSKSSWLLNIRKSSQSHKFGRTSKHHNYLKTSSHPDAAADENVRSSTRRSMTILNPVVDKGAEVMDDDSVSTKGHKGGVDSQTTVGMMTRTSTSVTDPLFAMVDSCEDVSDDDIPKHMLYGFLLPMKKGSPVPSLISNAIVANVDRLKLSVDGLVVKVASVIGESFPFDILMAVVPKQLSEREMLDSLERLCYQGLLKSSDGGGKLQQGMAKSGWNRFSFLNSMVWKSCYGMLLLHYRRGLHIAVARALLQQLGAMKEKDVYVSQACLHHILQATVSSAPSKQEIAEIGPLVWMQTLNDGVGTLVNLLETKFLALCSVGNAQKYVTICGDMIKSYQEWSEKISEDEGGMAGDELADSDMLLREYKLMLIKCRLSIELTGSIAEDAECLNRAFLLQSHVSLAVDAKLKFEHTVQPNFYLAYALQSSTNDYTVAWNILETFYTSATNKEIVQGVKHNEFVLEMASLLSMGALRLGDMERCDKCVEALKKCESSGFKPLCWLSHDSVAMLIGVVMLTRGLICINQKAFWNERQCLLEYCKLVKRPSMVWKVFGWLAFAWFALGEAPSFVLAFQEMLDHVSLESVSSRDLYDLNIEMATLLCELYVLMKEGKSIVDTYKRSHDMELVIDMYSEKFSMIEMKLEQIMELMHRKRTPMTCCMAFEACILAMNPSAREEALFFWEEVMLESRNVCDPETEPKRQENLLDLWLHICRVKHMIMKFEELHDSDMKWNTDSEIYSTLSRSKSYRDPQNVLSCTTPNSNQQATGMQTNYSDNSSEFHPWHSTFGRTSSDLDTSTTAATVSKEEDLGNAIQMLTSLIGEARNSKHTIRVIQLTCLKVRARLLLGDSEQADEDLRPIIGLIEYNSSRYSNKYGKMSNMSTIADACRLNEVVRHEKLNAKKWSSTLGRCWSWDVKSIYLDPFSVYGEMSFFEGIQHGLFNLGYYGPPRPIRCFKKFMNVHLVRPISKMINSVMMFENRRYEGFKALKDQQTSGEEADLIHLSLEEFNEHSLSSEFSSDGFSSTHHHFDNLGLE